MSNQEQLQEIINTIESLDEKYDHLLYAFPRGKLRILVQTIKEQQQEIDRLNNLYLDREKSLLDTIAACENLDEQLRQANEKLQEIKRACEYFKTTQDYYDSFLVNLIEEILEERKWRRDHENTKRMG
jgi:chromosome segregation ATPase